MARTFRHFGATMTVITGGYLLLNAYGIAIAMQDRTQGWHITPVPSYPTVRIIVFVTLAIGLQLLSARLLMPAWHRASRPWGLYAAMVGLCLGGCVVAVFVLLFLGMFFLDAGVI